MLATLPLAAGRFDDVQVLGELPPGNDQAALGRWDLPREFAAVWEWEEEVEFARRQDEQMVWSALGGWDF